MRGRDVDGSLPSVLAEAGERQPVGSTMPFRLTDPHDVGVA